MKNTFQIIFIAFVSVSGPIPVKSLNNRTASYTSIPSIQNSSIPLSNKEYSCCTNTKLSRGPLPSFPVLGKAKITNVSYVHAALDNDIYSQLQWPSSMVSLRERSTLNSWEGWFPCEDMIGDILHVWKPSEEENLRLHVNLSVYLLKIEDYIVPVLQDGLQLLDEVFEEKKL